MEHYQLEAVTAHKHEPVSNFKYKIRANIQNWFKSIESYLRARLHVCQLFNDWFRSMTMIPVSRLIAVTASIVLTEEIFIVRTK